MSPAASLGVFKLWESARAPTQELLLLPQALQASFLVPAPGHCCSGSFTSFLTPRWVRSMCFS